MQINIDKEGDVIYITSEIFGFTLYRYYNNGEIEDVFGYEGPEKYKEMCLNIACTVLDEK